MTRTLLAPAASAAATSYALQPIGVDLDGLSAGAPARTAHLVDRST